MAVSVVPLGGELHGVREAGQLDLASLRAENLVRSDVSVQNFGLVCGLDCFGDAVKSVLQEFFTGSHLQLHDLPQYHALGYKLHNDIREVLVFVVLRPPFSLASSVRRLDIKSVLAVSEQHKSSRFLLGALLHSKNSFGLLVDDV